MTRILLSLLLALTCYAPTPLFLLQNGATTSSGPAPLNLSVAALQYLRTPPAGAIATWIDESGNGNNATQGTTAKRPTGIDAAYNGKSCARFDGVDDLLTHSTVSGAAAWFVVKLNTVNTVVSYIGGGNSRGWIGDINNLADRSGPGGFDAVNVRNANSSNRLGTSGLRTVLCTSTKVFIDGAEVSGYFGTGTLGNVSTTQLGSRSDLLLYFGFDLIEYAVFDGTPTSGDLAALQTWAEDQYAAP